MLRLLVVVGICTVVLQQTAADCTDAKGDTYQTGDQVKPKNACYVQTCQENGAWTALGCAEYQPRKGFKKSPENPSLPYPQCCSHEVVAGKF